MILNKLDNFIKNTEGRILYVSSRYLDSTDGMITNGSNTITAEDEWISWTSTNRVYL